MLASDDDPDAPNGWANPRRSNLFNKVTLHILQADFFQFLCDRELGIDSVDAVPDLVSDWIGEVNIEYFARDWSLSGVKRDSTGIRNQWAFLWSEYRKDPVRVPRIDQFRKVFNP